ncbi:MAG: hypothetical protein ABSB13_08645 [Candidatus Binatus sp.]|uniref:hypothetical protein n=1 Tax=Candidatus Binatus sp. TaxID=2811406 RepID=UPI003D09E1B6
MPALCADGAGVLEAAGSKPGFGVGVAVGRAVGHGGQLSVQSSMPTPTPTC